jgi:hypothetical protein
MYDEFSDAQERASDPYEDAPKSVSEKIMKQLLLVLAVLLAMTGVANAGHRHLNQGFGNGYQSQRNIVVFSSPYNYNVITPMGGVMYYAWPQQRVQQNYIQQPSVIDYGVPGHRWIRSGWND